MLIYADTADLSDIEKYNEDDRISGFTTNPTILKREGVTDPRSHAQEILRLTDKPVSIDGPPALIQDLAPNAVPKMCVPMYTDHINREGVRRANFTAVCSYVQLDVLKHTQTNSEDIISVFAGRIMDTGTPPFDILTKAHSYGKVLWASTRSLYDIALAERIGCDIITLTPQFIEKLDMLGEHLDKVARRTLKQFYDDNKGLWE